MTVHYIAGFLFAKDLKSVALLRKTKPGWMAGKWNAVGGHVEGKETSIEAMDREWNEEVASDARPEWTAYVKLEGKGFDCTFHYAVADFSHVMAKTDEIVLMWPLPIPASTPMLGNVRWLIEMALSMIEKREKAVFFNVVEHGTNQEHV